MTDILRVTSLESLYQRIGSADSRALLSAAAALAAEIDGCLYSGVTPSKWDEERFDAIDSELRKRGTYAL